ncbi:MAG: FMN-binding protein [Prevotella sp.]|jgi:Na+-transporting NADH:ubiquinone oxidoreductase subunit C
MKTNSNSYTIIYSSVIVIIVAFLLAFVYQALKPRQDANVSLDVKKQILNSLNIRDLDNQAAEAKYAEVVKESKYVMDGADTLHYYICNLNGETKYVFQLRGMGLWGGISGYLSVNADKETVYGAYFNHESETAGLGAEIKDNRSWQEKFQGKRIFATSDKNHDKVVLSVDKKYNAGDADHTVDAVTGATLTSNGVRNMLQKDLTLFKEVLTPAAGNEDNTNK